MKNRSSGFFSYLKTIGLFCFILMVFLQESHSQFYNGSQLTFGKNRVQHQKFNWTYFRTTKFDVYFYPNGKELAQYTLYKAPVFIEEIERMLNFSSSKKLQFIVYTTQSDFRESNFAFDNDDFYNQGGVTNIYGTKIYLYFDGDHGHLDKMIRSGIMNIYAHLLVEGQSVGSNITSESLNNVPVWYYSGLASYVGENWNSEIDAYVKNGILTKKYVDFDQLSPVDATYAGHSFWKFIVDRYGKNAIANILHTTRTSRSYERGFYYVTGVSYEKLLVDWYRYYFVMYRKDTKKELPEGEELVPKPKTKREYSNIIFSPDGESYAYTTNEAGQVKIWLKTPGVKKPKKIFTRYQKVEDNPDLTYPKLAWHPNGEILGFTIEDRGRCYYYPYMIEDNKLEKRLLVDVEKITDWSYSDDGRLMLFSGFRHGQSDIFIYSFLSRSIQNITNDIYDDYQPRFMNNQKKIIFSSKRSHDTIPAPEKFFEAKPQSFYDLYLYHYDTKEKELLQVTRTPYANETNAQELSRNEILFLSDENGINNRYIARFDSVISKIDTIIHYAYTANSSPLTDNAYSIFEQDYNSTSGDVADIMLYDGVKRILKRPVQLNPLTGIQKSAFQEEMWKERQKQDSLALISKPAGTRKTTPQHGFFQVRQSDLLPKKTADTLLSGPEKTGFQPNALTEGIEYIQPVTRNYNVQYTLNKLVTQADFSFLNTTYQQFTGAESPIYLNTGLNALFMVGINDLFENYRISGGVRLSFDLESNEFMFSFEDLSRRVDHQVIIYRQSIKSMADYDLIKQKSNSIFYIIKYPFNKLTSLRLTLTGRYENFILGALDDLSLRTKNENHVWAGAKMEFVFDSSKELYTNLWRGSKMKFFVEYQHRLEKDQKNLLVLGMDIRKSVKVYKNMTWATRFAASTNFGSGRLIYYMGGIDNWMLAKFNRDISVDRTIDYAYQTLATNMRGFTQNIRNGTSFALLNTELRVPFVQLIARKRLSNNFLNSLQLVLFGDIGTAWTGLTPYSEENSLYTRYVESGYISAVVRRQVEPIVCGFGAGLRASLLGYFLRFDYAWGVEDARIVNPKGQFMFSIGLDF